MNDALGGQFEILSTNASPTLVEHIKAGRLRPLAIGAPRRMESLPQVPTLAELGYPQANLSSHFGFFAPGNLPVRILDRLNGEINAALETPEIRKRIVAAENVPTGGSARDFARQVSAEADSTARIVKAVGIKAD
jgi:tripartite-type tricarboxylate transporter receptor subunit TctC